MSAVEFAMVLPFLIALLITTVEFGRMYYSYQRLDLSITMQAQASMRVF
ncbi:TadE family protein [Endozoicomonas acroporae]|nr:TadE family protein [Endozoicomonas acroporae]